MNRHLLRVDRKRRFPGRKTSVCKEWRPMEHGNYESYLVGVGESSQSIFFASATGQMVIQFIIQEVLKGGRFISRKEQGWY